MKPRVVIAVADRMAWAKHRAALPNTLEVFVVESGIEALTHLKQHAPVAALVAELRVPGISGLDLLAEARHRWPDTGRILIVSSDDREAAIEAINRAAVHAFFIEPFSSEVFATAVCDAIERRQQSDHLRTVVAQLGDGAMQLLTGLLNPAQPPAPAEDAIRLRERVRVTAQALKLPTIADLEIAALLSRVALASVPPHILQKLLTHERLAPAETETIDRIPAVTLQLVAIQPRFAGVAEILRHQGLDPGPMTVREDGVREHKVLLASRILRAVIDLQLHENAGLSVAAALAELRRQSSRYDPAVLKALEELFAPQKPAAANPTEECMVEDLVVGCVLGVDALSPEGVPLVSAGTTLTGAVLAHLRNFAELGEIVEPLYIVAGTRDATQSAADGFEVEAEVDTSD